MIHDHVVPGSVVRIYRLGTPKYGDAVSPYSVTITNVYLGILTVLDQDENVLAELMYGAEAVFYTYGVYWKLKV